MNARVAPNADRNSIDRWLFEGPLQPFRRLHGDFRIENDVEIRLAEPG